VIAAWILTLAVAGLLPAAAEQRGHAPTTFQEAPALSDVAFLSGCWRGTMGSQEVREEWSDEAGGVMHYSTRFLRDGAVVDWEFGRIVFEAGTVVLWPYPRGQRSADGFPLVRAREELVFENLEHDFPVRIVYRRDGARDLYPRIEGSDGEMREWSLSRVQCPG